MPITLYTNLLQHHDWEHEYSDDSRAYHKGRLTLATLLRLQREQDPHFALWNAYAPEQYQKKGLTDAE